MRNEAWIEAELAELRAKHLERLLRVRTVTERMLNFSSNDYLGLSHHPAVLAAAETALRQYGAGAGAARLVTGTLPIHEELERMLAAVKGYPAALLFGSGYLTNTGIITTVAEKTDAIFADRLVHASILDATHLSQAELHRFRHNDPGHLEVLLAKHPARRRLVITEAVFSMDGDIAPLRELADVAARHEAMFMVDEAHSTGVFGPAGAGLVREQHLENRVNISMGTLSKALGSYGGFVACSPELRALCINRARSFIYSTALPPAAAGAALGALRVLEEQPDMGARLLANAAKFRQRLQAAGLNTMQSASQIIPILIGENEQALRLATRLRGADILVVAIRPPTVPQGTARLRLSVSLAHTLAQLEQATETIIQAARAEGVV